MILAICASYLREEILVPLEIMHEVCDLWKK
jgi:hypothetical protein